MEWPSKSIVHGGILHPSKTTYSSETHKFLKVLMDESKMSMQLRRKIDYHLRNGEPLPPPTARTAGEICNKKMPSNVVPVRPGSSKRRTRDSIVKSGAYEREKYVRREPIIDREKEKLRFINKLAFGDNIQIKPPTICVKQHEDGAKLNRFDELENEIKEREDWLQDMNILGEGEQHKLIVKQQIQSKIREMQQLKLAESSATFQ